ncbi:preprotein translocase subunit SecG [Rhizobium sp. CC-YZS058]|uniref:preprotein translocase subunit SecG n=1 Tax=Rhizobium sp. CC-YZS058 TaxID=3042153 RepID=UPI002B057E8A|nr:preprotein translocase subunit SecG [Rhizobium sp. CC-YZS058]MEA3535061.1 preprotein translocase subunit SecG [Rhizobium sp. CC-YZS058]
MQTVLLVIYLMVVLALIGVVLIQRSEGGGLGIGGGSGFMSARGTANALTRTTAILAALFFILALAMGIYARYQPSPTSVLDRIPGTTNNGNGVLDSLGGGEATTPPANQTNGQAPATEIPSAPAQQAPAAPAGDAPAAPAAQAPAADAPAPSAPATQAPATEAPASTPAAPAASTPAAPTTDSAPASGAAPATPPATGTQVPSGQ